MMPSLLFITRIFGPPPRLGSLIVCSISVAGPDKPLVMPLVLLKQDERMESTCL